MNPEKLAEMVIAGAPNLIVALAAIWWLSRKVDQILMVLLTMLEDRIEQDRQNDRQDDQP